MLPVATALPTLVIGNCCRWPIPAGARDPDPVIRAALGYQSGLYALQSGLAGSRRARKGLSETGRLWL